ncbi:MAG: hypothetical protein GKR96_05495 [Gammaproteobacteria bacterium]|nr:hypothetical protein [Gammaproteobacteria bacterium]
METTAHDTTQTTEPSGRNSLVALMVAIALGWLYLHFFAFKAYVELDIETEAARPDFVKIYWADEGAYFQEQDKNRVRINRNQQHYSLFIGDLGESRKLRIDPMEYQGEITIRRVSIHQFGYAPIVLDDETGLARLLPVNQLELPVYEDGGLKVKATGSDPQLSLEISPVKQYWILPIQHVFSLIAIFGFVWVCQRLASGVFNHLMFVPASLLVVVVMVMAMASITGQHVHPDETVHMGAISYYGQHFLPPPVESELVQNTFSVYGYSRLSSMEMYYQLAGYFTRILQPLQIPTLLSARLFGVVMLLFLLLFSLKRADFRYFLLPLLASAQAWYLFSYANSDGFALFLSILMSYQIASRQSLFNRFLSEPTLMRFWPTAIGLGAFCGSLLLIKDNYYFCILFFGMFLLWRFFAGEFADSKRFWTRVGILVIIGLSLYGARFGLHVVANGFDSTRIEEQRERHAKELYKPSTELDKKHAYLFMKERGVSLEAIVSVSRWGEKVFITAFGAYGFTQFLGTATFYDLVRYSGALIIMLMLFGVLINGPPSAHWLFFIGLACVTLLVGSAFWHSWTVSFQPQGRYMMPIIPILGVLYYRLKDYFPRALTTSLICFLFLLATYSFVFIGLHDVPKLDYVL